MKEKILTLIIGVLIGAILAIGGCFIYSKITKSQDINNEIKNRPPMMQNGEMPSESQIPENGQKPKGEIPEKPEENDNTQEQTEQNTKNKKENSTKNKIQKQ